LVWRKLSRNALIAPLIPFERESPARPGAGRLEWSVIERPVDTRWRPAHPVPPDRARMTQSTAIRWQIIQARVSNPRAVRLRRQLNRANSSEILRHGQVAGLARSKNSLRWCGDASGRMRPHEDNGFRLGRASFGAGFGRSQHNGAHHIH
jgi:hypothetical protein